MAERIIIFIACFMCCVPFLIVSIYQKEDGVTPIVFWSGSENKLKKQIRDIKGYNGKMAELYKKCAIAFLICGLCGAIFPITGYILLGGICTIGIYVFYKEYKKILGQFHV